MFNLSCSFRGDLMLGSGENYLYLYPEFTIEAYGKVNHNVEIIYAAIPPPPTPTLGICACKEHCLLSQHLTKIVNLNVATFYYLTLEWLYIDLNKIIDKQHKK